MSGRDDSGGERRLVRDTGTTRAENCAVTLMDWERRSCVGVDWDGRPRVGVD
jgi:hypothetical protein